MSDKHIKIPISRFEANRRLLLDIYVFLPRNNRYIRLRQLGQYFEQKIIDNYKSKGHSAFFVASEGLEETDPQKIILHDYSAPLITKEHTEGSISAKEPADTNGGATILAFPPKTNTEQAHTPADKKTTAEVFDIVKKRAPQQEAAPTPEQKEREKKQKEAKARFFEEKMKNIRERQVQEKEQKEKKEAALTARKKREEEIKESQAAAKAILDEAIIKPSVEDPLEKIKVKGAPDQDTSQKIGGKTENENASTLVRGRADDQQAEEFRFNSDEKPKEHRKLLANTDKLNETMERLKESFLQKHAAGTLDSFETARLDPDLEQEIERAIISNEIGKKLVVLGMQLDSIKEREREVNSLTHDEIEENKEFRIRILGKVEQVEKNLCRNKGGEKIDAELREELNIDFIKEELIESIRDEKNPLEVVFNLDKKVEEIKVGLAKTEHLIETKEITKIVAAAAPGKPQTLEETLFSGSNAQPEDSQEKTLLSSLSKNDPLRQDFYQRLSNDKEMKDSSEVLAQHFKNNFINEISNYTAQIGLAQGFHHPAFLHDLVMAAMIYLRSDKETKVDNSELPQFTRELLKRSDTLEDMDSTYVESMQIIALVKEIISEEGFTPGTARIDQKLLDSALQNALGKEEIFSLTFLERTKQFVDKGIRLHDAGLSFQLSRDAILDLRKACR